MPLLSFRDVQHASGDRIAPGSMLVRGCSAGRGLSIPNREL